MAAKTFTAHRLGESLYRDLMLVGVLPEYFEEWKRVKSTETQQTGDTLRFELESNIEKLASYWRSLDSGQSEYEKDPVG